jgi:uncharacterized damage-inducible protein DinB
MHNEFLAHLLKHNNWANHRIIHTCLALTAEQLDAAPASATMGTIRETLTHLVRSQHGYLSILTQPVLERVRIEPALDELEAAAARSGAGLLAVARGETQLQPPPLRTRDGYDVEPWVVLNQVINHATEHREQIKSMLTALGVAPPDIDGWHHGLASGALVKREEADSG